MASVKENLIAAKALIDTPEKWIKGEYEENGCFCSIGAVSAARKTAIPTVETEEECLALVMQVPDRTSNFISELHHYNDLPETTHADIMALFDRAIASQP